MTQDLKKKIQNLGLFDFHFSGSGAPTFVFLFTKLAPYKALFFTSSVPGLVILFVIGKGLGLVWAPCIMFIFPLDNFGFVFGFMHMAAIPVL